MLFVTSISGKNNNNQRTAKKERNHSANPWFSFPPISLMALCCYHTAIIITLSIGFRLFKMFKFLRIQIHILYYIVVMWIQSSGKSFADDPFIFAQYQLKYENYEFENSHKSITFWLSSRQDCMLTVCRNCDTNHRRVSTGSNKKKSRRWQKMYKTSHHMFANAGAYKTLGICTRHISCA